MATAAFFAAPPLGMRLSESLQRDHREAFEPLAALTDVDLERVVAHADSDFHGEMPGKAQFPTAGLRPCCVLAGL
eukprot:scaffold50157_cov33-Phaeocystis_antarctica.AAC.1